MQKKIKLILLSFLNLYYKYQDTNLVCKNVKKNNTFYFFQKGNENNDKQLLILRIIKLVQNKKYVFCFVLKIIGFIKIQI